MAQPTIRPTDLRAGKASNVAIDWHGPTADHPEVTLELRVREHHNQRLRSLDLRPAARRVIASVPVPVGESVVPITVPPDVTPAYSGVIMGWEHELALVDAQSKTVTTRAVSVAPADMAPADAVDTSNPLLRSKLSRDPGTNVREQVGIGLMFLVAAAASAVFGIVVASDDDQVPLYIGFGAAVAFGLISLGALSAVFSPGRALNGMRIVLHTPTAALGSSVNATLQPATVAGLEIGLICVELVDNSFLTGSGVQEQARVHTIHEEFVPFEGRPVSLSVPHAGPLGYAGENVALHWLVRVRSSRTEAGSGGASVTIVSA